MSCINRATVLGYVGKDPEIRTMQSGDKVAGFSIATSKKWKDKNTGEPKESTEWHNIAVFVQGLVGIIEQYVHKGSKLLIEGELKTRKWQDQNGIDRYTTDIVLSGYDSKLILIGGKEGGGNRPPHPATGYENPAALSQPASFSIPAGGQDFSAPKDDDIPF